MPILTPKDLKKKVESLDENDERWCRFWELYPRKMAKHDARVAWVRLDPSDELVEAICSAVEQFKRGRQWTDRGGQFIPYAATFLNGRRWEDSIDDSDHSIARGVKIVTRDHAAEGSLPVARRPKKNDTEDPT